MNKFLVDSDIIIWYLKGREKEAELLEDLSKQGKLLFSVVTITEVRVGLTISPQKIISGLKDIFIPIDITPKIAELAGEFKQKYNLDIADMLIAASAAITNSTLVTYNRKHFPMPQVSLYKFK
ncbi:MAG: type II toxin-antitoxin system VapC family toxin [Patescibacteria group bacterium]